MNIELDNNYYEDNLQILANMKKEAAEAVGKGFLDTITAHRAISNITHWEELAKTTHMYTEETLIALSRRLEREEIANTYIENDALKAAIDAVWYKLCSRQGTPSISVN